MESTPVVGQPVRARTLLVGQAPGVKEPALGKPFAWTAGKTLFRWFQSSTGLDEETVRSRVYFAAVCRCYPGKNPKGGDRVPGPVEVEACRSWLAAEIDLLRPELIVPVGRLAIAQFLQADRLDQVIGKVHSVTWAAHRADCIPLPHPSGASTWHRTEPGKTLLAKALKKVARHPAFGKTRRAPSSDKTRE